MNTNKFAKITKQILTENRKSIIDAYHKTNGGPNSAILLNLGKEVLTGKANVNFYIVSEKKNQPLYLAIPEFMKDKILNNQENIYIIFKGWDGLIASYFIAK
ncbi:MAG TPA: hypothetical protein VK783_16410 [Bacteroidia bacterium]|jgi:hypothetical protein|nr:hypothetical protein [Bacteroidia bacterium]